VKQGRFQFTLKRILVPLDASEHSMAALNIAAELAAAQRAELEGLFVEDINLLQLCEFPFVREISYWGTSLRPIDRLETERQLRVRAQQLKMILANVAREHNVPWKFRVTRGGVPSEVLAAAENADLTVLGGSGWSMHRSRMAGSTVRSLVLQGRGLTLIIQKGMLFQPPVQVLFTGSELSERALSLALTLSRKKDLSVLFLIAFGEQEMVDKIEGQVKEICAGQSVQVAMRVLPFTDLDKIAATSRSLGSGPMFIPCEEPHLYGEKLQELISSMDNPVFLVRQKTEESA